LLPVLFKIGPYPVHAWGLLLMVGFLLAAWRAARNSDRLYRIPGEYLWDVSLWGLFGGIVGARLAYVLQNIPEFARQPLDIFAIWTGGMTFYGGLVGGVLAGALVCRAHKISIADTADLAALSFPIGYFFGRLGCFLNGCCYGGVCPVPPGVRFHTAEGLTPPSHPAQLYAAAAAVLMYLILRRLEPHRRFPGQLMLGFLFLYGLYRFLVEFVRAGATAETTALLGLTTGQIASLVLMIIAGLVFALGLRRGSGGQVVAAATGGVPGEPAARAKKPTPSPARR
jgi:phosphatidylglycerol:prolipoprotein diacylglycerol transferase